MANRKVIYVDGNVWFDCPGCPVQHCLNVDPKRPEPRWGFNGSEESPTLTPSILARFKWTKDADGNRPEVVCHSFVTNGMIQFLDDCTHGLKGKTIPLDDVDAEFYDEMTRK